MSNIGETIEKICRFLAGILVVLGLILGFMAFKDTRNLKALAFIKVFLIYLGSAFGTYCFGQFFGYLDEIHQLLRRQVQFIEDKNAPKHANNNLNISINAADELKKCKELLDQNVINEEEFKKKKIELLELI